MPDPRAPRLAVLIDADNVPAGYAEAIFEEIAALGEAIGEELDKLIGKKPATLRAARRDKFLAIG